MHHLNAIKRVMWLLREGDRNCVTRPDNPGMQNNTHNPGLSNHTPLVISPDHEFQQPRLERGDLSTRISKSGNFDHRVIAQMQVCALRQTQ